jgi:hypothetical protein
MGSRRSRPANRSAEPASLVVRVDFDDRAELLAAAPDVYYVTDHYVLTRIWPFAGRVGPNSRVSECCSCQRATRAHWPMRRAAARKRK